MRSRLVCFKHITYAIIALVLSVCGTEVGLRVYDSYTGELSAPRNQDIGLCARCWWMHHRLKPLIVQQETNPDSGAPVEVRTNSFGLRGEEISVPKPPGVFRVVMLGDESTLAAETELSETFPVRLQELLQQHTKLQVEVINAGVSGYCPLLSYLQVRHSLLTLEPDLFVLNFDMTDVADDHRYRRWLQARAGVPDACPHPSLEHHRAESRPTAGLRFLMPQWCVRNCGVLFGAPDEPEDLRDIDAPHGRYAWLRDNPPDWSIYIEQALAPIGQLSELAERAYAPVLLSVIPAPWQISEAATSGREAREAAGVPANTLYRNRNPFELLQQYAERRSIRFCDASNVFRKVEKPERLYLRNAPRLSTDGHWLYARVLERALAGMLPGSTGDSTVPRRRPAIQAAGFESRAPDHGTR